MLLRIVIIIINHTTTHSHTDTHTHLNTHTDSHTHKHTLILTQTHRKTQQDDLKNKILNFSFIIKGIFVAILVLAKHTYSPKTEEKH